MGSIQESAGQSGHGINQSASRSNMVAASYFPQLVIGYNKDNLPSNSRAPKLETVNASALRQNAGPLGQNARPMSFMELLNKHNTAGFQSDEADEAQGYYSPKLPHKSPNKIYGPSSSGMLFMPNNCPTSSDGLNTTSPFPSNAITTAAVTTTTAKVQSLPREMHEDCNNTNVNWLTMSQASQDSDSDVNKTTNIGVVDTTSSAKEMNNQSEKSSNVDYAITPFESAVPIRARAPNHSVGHRTSIYRGVTRHRWTGRYEAHLWDNTSRQENRTRKGRQVYLGGFDEEEKAAKAYDMAALKYWGPRATTNFPISQYKDDLEEMQRMTRQEYVASLRRNSSGFSRGASQYRGVTRHHQQGKWQARIGRVAGNKDLYLGTFNSEKEAAEAYDIAAIKFRDPNAVTNFDRSSYDLETIENYIFPIGVAKRLKVEAESAVEGPVINGLNGYEECALSSQTDAAGLIGDAARAEWLSLMALQQQSKPLQQAYQLQKVSLYNQDLHRQLHSGNQQKYLKDEAESVNNGLTGDDECTLNSQTDATGYIGDAARAEWLALNIALEQQSKPLQANQLQKVALYNHNLHTQFNSANKQKYVRANHSTHELQNVISLGSTVDNKGSSFTPGVYNNISNRLAINSLLVAQPYDCNAVIFGENSGGSSAAKSLTYGNMLMAPEHLARNNLYYLSQQQQSSRLAKASSDNLVYNNRMEAASPSNLTLGNDLPFSK